MSFWLKGLVVYLLAVSIAEQMMPGNKYEQYLRLFTGFLLILLLLQPVLKIGAADSYLERKITEFVQEQEQLEAQVGAQGERFWQESEQMQEEITGSITIQEILPVKVEVTKND